MGNSKSKYASVLPSLPKAQPEDLDQQGKIDKLKLHYKQERVCRSCGTILEPQYDACPSCDGIDLLVSEVRHTPESLAKHYMADRLEYDRVKELLSDLNRRVEAWEQLLVESADADEPGWGLYGASENTVKLVSGASVAIQWEPQGKVRDKEAFRLWCVAHGLEKALQLWPSTMNAMAKERLLAGEPNMDGVEVVAYPKVVFRKG